MVQSSGIRRYTFEHGDKGGVSTGRKASTCFHPVSVYPGSEMNRACREPECIRGTDRLEVVCVRNVEHGNKSGVSTDAYGVGV